MIKILVFLFYYLSMYGGNWGPKRLLPSKKCIIHTIVVKVCCQVPMAVVRSGVFYEFM